MRSSAEAGIRRKPGDWGEQVGFSFDLVINALIAGILLGGFYAAVTIGVSISFGILDIVNIAHPAFIILGSYIAYIVNTRLGIDPIVVSVVMLPVFYLLGAGIYQVYYESFEKHGQDALRGLSFFFGLLFVTEVMLILVFGVDYRYVEAPYIGPSWRLGVMDFPLRMLVPCLAALAMFGVLQIILSYTFIGRAISAVAQDQLALRLMARLPDPHQAHRLRHLDRDHGGRRRVADHHPAGRALGRTRIYRPRVRDLRARRPRQPARHGDRGDAARHHRELHGDLLRAVLGAGGGVRRAAPHARIPAGGSSRAIGLSIVRTRVFLLVSIAVAAVVFFAARMVNNDYVFFAGYTILQFIVLATAWNILGGYTGYVNFGSAAFFAIGAYSTVFFHKAFPMPIPLLILIGGIVSGIVGFGMGYLTLRLRGAFFAIATLALAVVLQTLVVNWDYVGGSRGAYVIRPNDIAWLGPYIQYLFLLMLALVVVSLTIARWIERSQLGYGFATIRDDELAAEASGVPTLRLKLIATTISGALMGMAGAPFPYYIGYLQPSSAFGLDYAVNSIAMPMIGGTTSWVGPADRRDPAGLAAADRDRHHLVGGQPADRRAAAGRLRHHRAERHRRAGAGAGCAAREKHEWPAHCSRSRV